MPNDAVLVRSDSAQEIQLKAEGDWVISKIAPMDTLFETLENQLETSKKLTIDLKNIGMLDTSGAWLINRLVSKWSANGGEVLIKDPTIRAKTLLREVSVPERQTAPTKTENNIVLTLLASLGEAAHNMKQDTVMGLNIIGSAMLQGPQLKENRRGGIRLTSIVHHIDKMALGAIPIIIVMSLFIGAIVAQQAAFQLRAFGLESIAPDWVGAILLREICVLLTAIMIAGRSGSSMTAEIGSMKMREEVDALKVIGLNPIGVLVFPRLVALTIAMPLLTFISNIAALVGAALLLRFYSDVPIEDFITRLRAFIDLETVFAGLIKAPFMGLVIGVMAAVEGLKVEGSTESLGQRTTTAVVKAIFFVVVMDGIFAIFYAAIDY
ncbi:MAG: ABC transporter permease [Rhizobiales bacterium]|nr:ABC transporter permease [Hyphomicrobiales bacterium]